MFERFTEKARRVMFFARYEASQYGSPIIETEHLLLGLLREDPAFVRMFLGQGNFQSEIRSEIEGLVTVRERISTAVEVPFSQECKKILPLARAESERLGHPYIGTEHLLLAILTLEGSLAAQLLQRRGVTAAAVREQLAKAPKASVAVKAFAAIAASGIRVKKDRDEKAKLWLDSFLAGLKWHNSEELIKFFAENAQFIDVFGKCWNREEIAKSFEALFAPYAKKNATSVVEEILVDASELFVARVLWKNAVLASLERIWIHQMSVVLIREGEDWFILLMHVTPVQQSP